MSEQDSSTKSPVLLPIETKEIIDEEWNSMLSQTQLFPMIITDQSKYNAANCPRPFPILPKLFNNQENQPHEGQGGETFDISSCTSIANAFKTDRMNNNYRKYVFNSNSRSTISSCGSFAKIDIANSKPSSPKAFARSRGRQTGAKRIISPCPRLKSLQFGPIDIQEYAGDRDLDLENSSSCTSSLSETSMRPSNSSSNIIQQDEETLNSNHSRISISNDTESTGELIKKGMALLTQGKEIIETSRTAGCMEARTLDQVVEKLKDVVNGQLKLLKEENEALRTVNNDLQKQLQEKVSIDSTKLVTTDKSTDSTVPQTNGIDSIIVLQETKIVDRLSSLENTMKYVLESHCKQTTSLQDRLFAQEVRYEETLAKFEEVIENMSNMYSGLQMSYKLQTTNGISKSAKGFKRVIETMAHISPSKRVQFKKT